MAYHPRTNSKDLPPVASVQDLDKLPWGGNHWWDWPILQHVESQTKDLPRAQRKAICDRAEFLMTGIPAE